MTDVYKLLADRVEKPWINWSKYEIRKFFCCYLPTVMYEVVRRELVPRDVSVMFAVECTKSGLSCSVITCNDLRNGTEVAKRILMKRSEEIPYACVLTKRECMLLTEKPLRKFTVLSLLSDFSSTLMAPIPWTENLTALEIQNVRRMLIVTSQHRLMRSMNRYFFRIPVTPIFRFLNAGDVCLNPDEACRE